jgi:murein DD-endopeptidase MepM/ murein hydrolase activator NlpD
MYWPLLTDAAANFASVLRAHLPWVLLASGLVIQAAGVVVLAHRHSHAVLADLVATSVAGPSDPNLDVSIPEHARFAVPILDGKVPQNPALLPGARRAYRGGEHEGVDFRCRPGTEVRAAAAGWVLSIDDEPNLPEGRRNEVLEYSRARGRTPPEVLEVLHGRRIVLCHGVHEGRLLTTTYSHLEHVRSGLKPGDRVERGDVIGVAGASGTSHAYGTGDWAELHFEVRVDGEPLGAGLEPTQAGALYRSLLSGGRPE